MPNDDMLTVYFKSRPQDESAADSRMIQVRLRHGAERWDPPSLFYDTKGRCDDQSALLWTDATSMARGEKQGASVRFFGGVRTPNWRETPFKMAMSAADYGATWAARLPLLAGGAPISANQLTPQPITSAWAARARFYLGWMGPARLMARQPQVYGDRQQTARRGAT